MSGALRRYGWLVPVAGGSALAGASIWQLLAGGLALAGIEVASTLARTRHDRVVLAEAAKVQHAGGDAAAALRALRPGEPDRGTDDGAPSGTS